MSRTPILFFVLALLVSGAPGCAAFQRTRTVDDSLLAEVTADKMADVQQARAERDASSDALAKAARDTEWAESQVELARAELKSLRVQLEEAKLATVVTGRDGTGADLQEAERRYEYVAALTDASRGKLALRKRELEHQRLLEKVAREHSRLLTASVELAKARAVQGLDRLAARKVTLREFERQVGFQRTELALAQVRADAAAERVAEARRDHDAAAAAAVDFTVS